MFTPRFTRSAAALGLAAAAAMVLAGCGSSDSLGGEEGGSSNGGGDSSTIVVGSQEYYSNEIVAEIYAQALEGAGFDVKRQFSIGQRDAYMPEVESGAINLFPEYTGNLLEFYSPDTTATSPDEVYAELQKALPESLTALEYAEASDQDTYTVTAAFAKEHNLTTIADLANVKSAVTIGAPPEFEQRPYGPAGAKSVYGIDLGFSATGATTLESLLADQVQVADIYSADPAFQTQGLVALEDPKNMILSSNIVPIASADIAEDIAGVINPISKALTVKDLVALNVQSSVEKKSTEEIAKAWLADKGLDS